MDLHKILDSQLAGWRADAACRDEPDEKLFISDRALSRIQPASPTLVAAMATCARCDVRKNCLAEALTPVVSPVVRSDERAGAFRSNGSISHMRLTGVWGGTTDDDRHTVAHLPLPEAVDVLEASFPKRLAAMADLFERKWRRRPAKKGRPGRAKALLAEPQVRALLAVTRRRCLGCTARLPTLARSDARYCSGRCRMRALRARAA